MNSQRPATVHRLDVHRSAHAQAHGHSHIEHTHTHVPHVEDESEDTPRVRLRGGGRFSSVLRRPSIRRFVLGAGVLGLLLAGGAGWLWWRLASGPIELDLATPWLTAAIEENFGRSHTVQVGGTQLERDEAGRPSLRILDIMVRDADGTVVASAPKAEVGLSAGSLLSGRVRAESLNLVGAEMAVRIETDGRVTVFAGADNRPIATAPPATIVPPARPLPTPSGEQSSAATQLRNMPADVTALLAWIDGLSASGLDGYALEELGLKNGNLVVDDRRNGKRWNFSRINLSLTRPKPGGVIFRVNSENPDRPWQLSAAVTPLDRGARALGLEARQVSSKDLLLALRMGEGAFDADLLLSASIRGEIAPDGTPRQMEGQILAESGYISDLEEPITRIDIDRAEIGLNWNAERRQFHMPFQIVSGGNRITLLAKLEASRDQSGLWNLEVDRDPVIDPVILAGNAQTGEEPLILNRAVMRARVDLDKRRIDLDQGDLGRTDVRPTHNMGLAVSGHLDYSGEEPWLAFGIAATKMPAQAVKRVWPSIIAPPVRSWVQEHLFDGTVERLVIAANAPWPTFRSSGPPLPDEGLSLEAETSGTTIRPVETLPPIRDADLNIRITGRTATVGVGRGTVEVSPGRKLSLTTGVFEVPDTHPKDPPSRTRFRVDGSVAAAAELLMSERLREFSGAPFDPAVTRGTVTAQVALTMPLKLDLPRGSANYNINAEITNFVADRMFMAQKVEAPSLRVNATKEGYSIKGDAKINGVHAALEYRKAKSDSDAEVRLATTLDDAARAKLGFDFGSAVNGPMPLKLAGRMGSGDRESRFNVDADLTAAKIDNLLPGWVKPAGKSTRATFTFVQDKNGNRFDDVTIEGQGTLAKGSVSLDASGDLQTANFPVLAISDGDKLSLKADRGPDGAMRVSMRGDVYDGRNFVKSSLGSTAEGRTRSKQIDLDLDVKIGAVAGHHGEALRALDLRLSRRNGRIRSFTMNAKVGRDAPLIGDMRTRVNSTRQVLFFETNDAGAFFRFADVYPRVYGGKLWIAIDPPTQEGAPQDGLISLRDFAVRGEPALDKVVSGAPGGARTSIDFTQARAEFTRSAGRMVIRDGVVRGPMVGATMEGNIDYAREEVHMRGTFVPLYGLNNMFGQIPIVGLFLGGPNEGLLGITYEVTGPPGNPHVTPNPISAITPGALRKVFEFRDINNERSYEPVR